MVVCGGDLDDVGADKVEAREAADDAFDLAHGPSSRLWCSGYRRVSTESTVQQGKD